MNTDSDSPTTIAVKAGSPDSVTVFRLGYRPGLNGLRGLAILMVLAEHTAVHLPGRVGFMGVDIFFVLSGFLITCLLLEEWEQSGRISLRAFYMRRALRLLPALGMLLSIFTVYCVFFHGGRQFRSDLGEARATLFYYMDWALVNNWIQGHYLRHAWSLSIEEQFYLLWPPLLWLLLRSANRRSILNFVLLGIFCSCGWRWLDMAITPGSLNRVYLGSSLETRADALLIGCATAIVLCSGFPAKWGWTKRATQVSMTLSVFGLAIMALVPDMSPIWMCSIGWLLISLFSGLVILGLLMGGAGWIQSILETRWLVHIGTLSYSLYLWHYPVFQILRDDYGLPESMVLPLSCIIIISATLGSYYLVERPFLRLKRNYKKVRESISVDGL